MAADESKIFLGGLPQSATEQAVRTYFGYFGTINDVTMKYDQATGTVRNFAFVTFSSAAGAQAALANYDNNILDGKWIEVKAAKGKHAFDKDRNVSEMSFWKGRRRQQEDGRFAIEHISLP